MELPQKFQFFFYCSIKLNFILFLLICNLLFLTHKISCSPCSNVSVLCKKSICPRNTKTSRIHVISGSYVFFVMKIEEVGSSKTLVITYKTVVII